MYMLYTNQLIPEQITFWTNKDMLTWTKLFDDEVVQLQGWERTPGATYTRAYPDEKLAQIGYSHATVEATARTLNTFFYSLRYLYEKPRMSLYHTFKIPKAKGGFREICAPEADMKAALTHLKNILAKVVPGYHTAAYAYVPGRWTKDAVERHQKNASEWFLKTDLHDFFGSSHKDFVLRQMKKIVPFNHIAVLLEVKYRTKFEDIMDLCFIPKDGKMVLPQGSPASPFLTNLLMIPIDHAISRWCSEKQIVYTRYADDMLFSCKYPMDKEVVLKQVHDVLHDTPYLINLEKTRYGNIAGSNWNLGMMLNKDNRITIGYKTKQELKAWLNNFILDTKNGKAWNMEDVQYLSGKLNYWMNIEQEYIRNMIRRYEQKYQCTFAAMLAKYNINMKQFR